MDVRRAAVLLAALSALAATPAHADELFGTRADLEEREDRAIVLLDRGFARFVVERTVKNPGRASDQAVFRLELPPGAVAVGLRSRGEDTAGRPRWFPGDLLDAEQAAAEYRELTGHGEAIPKDPALLEWRGHDVLALQVFPVPPGADKTVEYTLLAPMRYEDGAFRLELPRLGTAERAASLRLVAVNPRDAITVNGLPAPPGAIASSRAMTIELTPRGGPALSASLAVVRLGPERVLVHERAVAAPRLAEVPAHAAVAVVLDASRSMGAALPAELAAARAFLSHFPDAEVTVVTFDRRPSAPFGTLPVAAAIARLRDLTLEGKNGSHLDDAIALADHALARAACPTRRILALTDLRTRAALTPARLASLGLTSGALVHLSALEGDGFASLTRDDDSPWAALPRRSGGLFWRATAPSRGGAAATRRVFEEWARPVRLDHARAVGGVDGFTVPDSLAEGQGVEAFGVVTAAPDALRIEGELWSTATRVDAFSSTEEEQRWSALAVESPAWSELSRDEQRRVAMRGGAVSPLTSYLAIEPGVRPSTDGLDLEERGVGEGGGGIGDGVGLSSVGLFGYGGSAVDPRAFLQDELGRAWAACGGHGSATIRLESTLDEVVDVGEIATFAPADPAADCLREAAWGLDLPSAFRDEHAAWCVTVEGA